MTHTIWDTIADIPWWTYPAFIYLIRLSLKAKRPHAISLRQLIFLPALFILFSFISIYYFIPFDVYHGSIWLLSACVAFLFGWLHFYLFRIKAIKNTRQLHVPGSYSLLVITIVMFTAYCLGYDLSAGIKTLMQSASSPLLIAIYGSFTGLFLGRLCYSLRAMKVGPYQTEIGQPLTE